MDGEMYDSPSVSKNLSVVQEFGYHILEPESGFLASGLEGQGRLPEFDAILEKASEIIGSIKGPLQKKKVVVTAGPTREFIDPVRFISNPSSGKMGFAMAKSGSTYGSGSYLNSRPHPSGKPEGVISKPIVSAEELFLEVQQHADADVIIMAAAVSDFTPSIIHNQKVKKNKGEHEIPLNGPPIF